jgi:hypothetical protein
MKNNMPTQPVHDLKIHPRENDLIIATHGRGAFIADITPLQELSPAVLTEDAHLFAIKSKVRWVGFDRANSSSLNFAGQSEPAGIVINYYLKSKPKGDVKIQVLKSNLVLNEINGSANPGLNSAVWNMTGRRERTADEKKAMQDTMRGVQGRVYGGRGGMDINYASFPVQEGEYKFVLTVDGKSYTGFASILKDYWYQ